jgi:ankyrin repeat protein
MKARPPLPDDIKELMRLVRAGKLFDVQKWIAAGKRTVPPKPYWFSPLRTAVEIGFHSMVEVLLQAGVEQDEKDYMLNQAVWNNKFELIKLLVDYGANINEVAFDEVCASYFWTCPTGCVAGSYW